jgi:hypothetical protein
VAIGRYDSASNKVDSLLGTVQERTDMVLVAKDLKTIFASNETLRTFTPPETQPEMAGTPLLNQVMGIDFDHKG